MPEAQTEAKIQSFYKLIEKIDPYASFEEFQIKFGEENGDSYWAFVGNYLGNPNRKKFTIAVSCQIVYATCFHQKSLNPC